MSDQETVIGNAQESGAAAGDKPADQAGTVIDNATPPEGSAPPAAPAEGEAPPAEGEDKLGDGDKATEGVPEAYEAFTVPEGAQLTDELKAYFEGVGKKLGLSQERAQAFVDEYFENAKANAEAALSALEEAHNAWVTEVKADKEFGGQDFDRNMQYVAKARDAFATPELLQLLNESRLGSHPEMVRLMYRVGKALSEDKFNPAGGATSDQARSVEDILYPTKAA